MAKLLEDKKYKFVIYILIATFITLLALAITIGTIKFNKKSKSPIAIVKNSGNITINYLDGNMVDLKKVGKGDHVYTFSITNSGDTKNYYSIYFKDCVLNKDDVSIRLETDNDEKIYNSQLLEGENLLRTIKGIEAGETERYKLIISNRSTASVSGEIYVINESLNEQNFADLILNTNNIKEPKTNVGIDSSISNEGLIASMDNDGPTYYFRGNVENNYLKIGDHMFRIVRINGDETVRVVLDEPIDIKTPYNLNESEDRKLLSGLTGSTVNAVLNKWMEDNLIDYQDYFAEGKFCTDSEFINESIDGKKSNSYQRIFTNNNVSFKCNGTTENLKVGLLSADEIIFAGATKDEANKTYYLHNDEINYSTWTTGSYELKNDGTVTMIVLSQNGGFTSGENIITSHGIRPVLNISRTAHIRGQGTKENPYVLVA